jgi:DNA-directed RNA polymerase
MNLIDEQIAIETNAHHEAKARYDKNKLQADDSFVRNPIQTNLLSYIVPKFAIVLEEWLNKTDAHSGRGGKWKTLYRNMKLDSVGMSLASLRAVFTNVMKKEPVFIENMSDKIYKAMYTENMYTEFRTFDKEKLDNIQRIHWKTLTHKIKAETTARNMKDKIKVLHYARQQLTTLQDIPSTDTIAAGLAIMRLVVELKVILPKSDVAVNIFQIVKIKRSVGKLGQVLKFTPSVEQYISRAEYNVSSILFTQFPMVVPPIPWEGLLGGGYVTPRGQGSMTLIKTRNLKLYKDSDIGPEVYEAINTIQATPWAINRRVYAVMAYCVDKELPIGELPVLTHEGAVGKRIDNATWHEYTPEEQRAVFTERKKQHQLADSMESKVRALNLKMSMSRRFLKYEKIYFPHSFDFRGRIYPISSAVNPQSDKYGQALLHFAEAEPLGKTGKAWLAVHGANTYGLDADSLSERRAFIAERKEEILASAEHPLRNSDFWGAAEDPYGFLAFCLEWSDMHKCADHTKHMCRLPVKLDATSSGLQHYSAIFRDERGAEATNLLDGERQDIYKKVADEAKVILSQLIADEKDVEEKQWKRSFIANLNRTLCKPATMCLPYGISLFGATDALADLKSKGKLINAYVTDTPEGMKKLRFLAQVIMEAVATVVRSAQIGMDWLKAVDKAVNVATETEAPRYQTALGFPFYQQYYKSNKKRVEAFFGDVRLSVSVCNSTKQLDKRKSNSAIAPNVIHSQDATHLAKVALAAGRKGIKSFSFIHDSFGVHPSRTEEFRTIIREEFVNLYAVDTLGGLVAQLKVQYPTAEIPEPPYGAFGTLDIQDCLQSTYMFN